MGYGTDGRASIPGRGRNVSVLHNVQTGSGAHPASYLFGFTPHVQLDVDNILNDNVK
jgi:hypothetical protein